MAKPRPTNVGIMQQRGVLKSWNDEKGFGFIAPEDGSADVFAHISAFTNHRITRPAVGTSIGFTVEKDERGRLRAGRAWTEFGKGGRGPARTWAPWVATFAAADFIGALGVAAYYGLIPRAVPLAYLTLSIVTFAIYAWDKWRAKRGGDRMAEATLHLLEMLGGWPGALAAQHWLRHKSRKRSYQVRFWIIVACHVGLWAWLALEKIQAAK
jgi:uncharacterized membrane protein YsdA (DUF1294 family)/cold shock CspA family protein